MPSKAGPRRVDLEALSDLCTPWCIHVVATLRIADHLAAGLTVRTAGKRASGRFVVECGCI